MIESGDGQAASATTQPEPPPDCPPVLAVALSALVVLGSFAEAGAEGAGYRVWLAKRHPDAVAAVRESRTRVGNVAGAIGDGDRDTFVVTYDGARLSA